MGLAVLSKGLIGIVLPGGALVLYCLLRRDWRIWRRLHLGTGLPALALVTVPWFALVCRKNPEFFHFFFIREHIERYLTTIHKRYEPWWYFLPILARRLPALALGAAAGAFPGMASERTPGPVRPGKLLLVLGRHHPGLFFPLRLQADPLHPAGIPRPGPADRPGPAMAGRRACAGKPESRERFRCWAWHFCSSWVLSVSEVRRSRPISGLH